MQELKIEIPNTNNQEDSFNIITSNNKGEIVKGNLIVNDIERLKQIRDILIRGNKLNYNLKVEEKITLQGCEKQKYTKENNSIIKRTYSNKERQGLIQYIEKTYTSKNLNCILLFTSLIGQELNPELYKLIGKLFIENNIYNYQPLDKIWIPCRDDMLIKAKTGNTQDLELFQATLQDGLIEYQPNKTYTLKEGQSNKELLNLNLHITSVNKNNKVLGLVPQKR